MEEKETTYYLINGTTVGRRIRTDDTVSDSLFTEGRWGPDPMFLILRSLCDACRPQSERTENTGWDGDVTYGITQIPEKEAMELITDQTMDFLIGKWKKEYAEDKRNWDKHPGWFAKHVTTEFVLNGVRRRLTVEELGLDRVYEGYFESIQKLLEKDLEEYGAVITASWGFLD